MDNFHDDYCLVSHSWSRASLYNRSATSFFSLRIQTYLTCPFSLRQSSSSETSSRRSRFATGLPLEYIYPLSLHLWIHSSIHRTAYLESEHIQTIRYGLLSSCSNFSRAFSSARMMAVISTHWFIGSGLDGEILVQPRCFPHRFLKAAAWLSISTTATVGVDSHPVDHDGDVCEYWLGSYHVWCHVRIWLGGFNTFRRLTQRK